MDAINLFITFNYELKFNKSKTNQPLLVEHWFPNLAP